MKHRMNRIAATCVTVAIMALAHIGGARAQQQQTVNKQQPAKPERRAEKVLRNFDQTLKVLIETSTPEAVMQDYAQARQLFQAGDIEAALTAMEKTMTRTARKPTFRVLWSTYDQTVQEYAQFKRAVAFMQTLVTEYPNIPDVRAALAAAYGEYASALQREQQPNIIEVVHYASLSLQQLDVALAIDPDNFMARLGRAITYSYAPGGLQNAEQDFDALLALQMLRKHPWLPYQVAYYYYAETLKRHDNPTRAAAILRAGLMYYPLDESLKKALAEINQVAQTK